MERRNGLLVVPIAVCLFMLFFMFYSFNIDRDKVLEGYRSTFSYTKRESTIETIAKQVSDIQTKLEEEEKEVSEVVSGTGQDVVDYAMQFVGNPYVYGGSSLTHGIDCSGFTMQIFKHFGITLPHSSSAQRSYGKDVPQDESKMRAGDIICYDGHVAIYDGKGGIVHASNHRDGIKTSPTWNYRKVICVRRLVE